MTNVPSANLDEELIALIDRAVARIGNRQEHLLPVLHAVQEERGFVGDDAVPHIAEALNLSRADVHGVLTFYHDFRREPPGAHIVKLCRAEACQARGSVAVEAAAEEALGTPMGSTRADRVVTLEPVYCLGLCAIGPNLLVDGWLRAGITPAVMREIADKIVGARK